MRTSPACALLLGAANLVVPVLHADVLLATDFTGRGVSPPPGLTVETIEWSTKGVEAPGNLTVRNEAPGSLPGLFDTVEAQGHLAPDKNVGNEGPWSVDVPMTLAPGTSSLTLDQVELTWRHFNNSGAFQTASRSVDWTVTVTGPDGALVGAAAAPNSGGLSGVASLVFTPPLVVAGPGTFQLTVRAAGSEATGNNTGLDAFRVEGSAVGIDPDSPPVILVPPRGQWDGVSDVVLAVVADGPGPLAYQWLRDGLELAEADEAQLTVSAAQWAQGGEYTVRISNANGDVLSDPAVVTTASQLTWEQMNYEPAGPSSRRSGISISEILYHPAQRSDEREIEFVELHNSQPWREDLSGWRLSGDITLTLPEGTFIPAHGYLVTARLPEDVEGEFGVTGVVGPWTGNLPNDGGRVRLRKPSGAIVQQVDYDDRGPWALAADGAGHSLVLARPSFGERDPRAWEASHAIGGSPGEGDPVPSGALDHVFVSAVLSNSDPPLEDFLELRNAARFPVSLSQCLLSDARDTLARYVVPVGTVIPANGTLRFLESELGFALDEAGDAVYLSDPDGTRVLDAVLVPPAATDVPLVRRRGDLDLRPVAAPRVVINELHFHPPGDEEADEWIELHNPGSGEEDLTGWSFTDGIEFTFPEGARIAAGGFLVVAKDRARTLSNHPGLDPGLVLGDYRGNLANGGERVALSRPEGAFPVVEDAIRYADRDRWHRFADGRAATLERLDPRADSLAASNWADSDESAKAEWTTIEATGTLAHGNANAPADQVQMFLMGPGEALVDGVEVIPRGGSNVLPNGDFEGGTAGWFFQGTHRRSRHESGDSFDGSGALRLVATRRGDPGPNRARAPLGQTLATGSRATLRARVRWLAGHPEFLLRFKGNWLEAAGRLHVPTNLGTPGARNSRALNNGGPAIDLVAHRPVLPRAGEPFLVTAQVTDSDGVEAVMLRYRRDPSQTTTELPMTDDGAGGDLVPGDGIYSAEVPAQANGTLIAFRVVAEDAASPAASSTFPPEGEALVRSGDPAGGTSFGTYRMWITAADRADWDAQPFRSNTPFPITFVYNDSRPIYAAGASYGGNRDSHGDPLSGSVSYDVVLPAGDEFLGADKLTLDYPVRDPTNQREQLMHWFADQLHLPTLHRRDIYLYMNGVRRRDIYHDAEQPDGVVVGSYFPGDEGELFKTSNDNETTDGGTRIRPFVRNLLDVFAADGRIRATRYRWTTAARARGSRTRLDDTSIVDLMQRADDIGPQYAERLLEAVDMENWMRTFALIDLASFWDAFGNPNFKNTYLYKPDGGRWVQFTWDFDVGLGVFNDPVDQPLFPANVDPNIRRMYQTPRFVRAYWRAMDEAILSFFSRSGVIPVLRAKDNAYRAAGLSFTSAFSPSGPYNLSVPDWITRRSQFIRPQLAAVNAPFAVLAPADGSSSAAAVIELTGTAPVAAARIEVNGIPLAPQWTSVNSWRAPFTLQPGANLLEVRALALNGSEVDRTSLTVTSTAPGGWPALVINEWMADNESALVDPADGEFEDWVELHNPTGEPVDLGGWFLSDDAAEPFKFQVPAAFEVPAGGFLLAWADDEVAQNDPGLRPDLHLAFRLDGEGESILLSAPDGTLVDRVDFGPQSRDKSMGRIGGDRLALANPSPRETNGRPAITPVASVTTGPEGVLIGGVVEPGFRYLVEASDDLQSWEELATIEAVGPMIEWTQPIDQERRFYRLQRIP